MAALPPPARPPKQPQPGFLWLPPHRVLGTSIAGEATCIVVPELDLVFDIGACPRFAIAPNVLALSHGHMDHAACVAYWLSQRHFLGCTPGQIVCHPGLERPLREVLGAWVGIERQRTPFKLVPLAHNAELPLKGLVHLRAFETKHTPNSLGFVAVEKRPKLRADLAGATQEQIVERKKAGENVTEITEIPLVAFTGDTAFGGHLLRTDVLAARILITECTFIGDDDDGKADIGRHMHLDDLLKLLELSKAEHVVITHLSRRTHLGAAREALARALKPADRERVHILMDARACRERWERQVAEAGGAQAAAEPDPAAAGDADDPG